MADRRRFDLAYRGSFTLGVDRRRRGTGQARARGLAERIRTAVSLLGDEGLNALLDEDFDELSCEPERLLQLTNQR